MNFIVEIIIAIILADFVVGIFHWMEDTYFCYNSTNPIIQRIAKDNELHHYYPRDIVTYSYLENMQVTLPLTMIILLIVFLINKKFVMKHKYAVFIFALLCSTSNIFHRFLHLRECEKSKILLFLQKNCILSNSYQHKIHHVNANNNYCVILYFTNVFLEKIHFWYFLENATYILFGIKQNETKKYEYYKKIQNEFHELTEKNECPTILTKQELTGLQQTLQKFKMHHTC
jgi:ubiquitin-conjugating enzyme E2 variant